MQVVLGIFLILHGIAHLAGFAAAFRLTRDLPYPDHALGGQVQLGHGGVQLYGVLWLLAAVGFAVVGIGAIAHAPWALGATLGMALASLVLCIAGWPDARIGVAINGVLIALVAIAL